ncbi:hypothetical protein CA13_67310 [Planctomycetes bacterium CA13]|uniref:Uncharacterized protein n=2 Tax=Novipirellula herctigrandis TaxID=2527986 RepID=A0A5C5YN16_9BACT|nr:hypothetical protein CA13_67310 [Planctomycetes bacterium CA13]
MVFRMLAPDTIGEQARRHFLSKLKAHYAAQGLTDLDISIRRGRFDPEVGIIFEGLRIADRRAVTKTLQEMIRIEQIIVFANVHPEKLLDKEVPLTTTRVALSGIETNVTLAADGTPSLAKLMPLPKFGPESPRMDACRAKVNLFDAQGTRRVLAAELAEFRIENLSQLDGSTNRTISLNGVADFASSFAAKIESVNGASDIRSTIRGLHIHRGLLDALPASFRESLLEAGGLDCVCDVTASMLLVPGQTPNYRVRSTIHEGTFSHHRLSKPVTQVQGVVTVEPGVVKVEASQANFGESIVRADGVLVGDQLPMEVNLNVATEGFLLDESFATMLTPKLSEAFNKLRPRGHIDVNGIVKCHDGVWDANADVSCRGVDVEYIKFPYPVRDVVGVIHVRDGIASSDTITGRIDSHRVQCGFRLPIRPGVTNEKTFVVAADGPVAIDATLIKALTHRGETQSKLESFVRTLRPRGSVHLASAMFGTNAAGQTTRELDLRIIDGHLRYEKFAYPLYNVEGNIQISDDSVRLVDFRGMSANSGVVLCSGTYQIPQPSAEPNLFRIASSGGRIEVPAQLSLRFRASTIPMDDSLRSSLPQSAQHIWDSVAPGGILDEADVSLTQQNRGDPLQIDLTARQFNSNGVSNRTLSLRPCSLPYRIDIAGGTVHYDGKTVQIDSIQGQHAASRLAADGFCIERPNGRWELTLNLKEGSRLNPDAELISALPGSMREAMRRLQLRGPVSLRGETVLTLPDVYHPEPRFRWDVALQLEGNRIADVGPVHSMRGEIKVLGSRDEEGIRATGNVEIDSMHVNDLQITEIRGPFTIIDERLNFGVAADPKAITLTAETGEVPQPEQSSMQGRVFDGAIEMRGNLLLSTGAFDADFTVLDASVPVLLADLGHSDNDLTGALSGKARFSGSLGTMDFLKGSGNAEVTGANVYQLPLIMQVLNQLRIKPSEDVAFTDASVDFTMFGDLITFNDLRLWGDWVALQGTGTLDGRRDLDLTFNTRVSPQNVFTQVVRPLRGDRYTLWTIDVKGPVTSPAIERRAFEGVGETLERLFPTMTPQPAPIENQARGPRSWFN